MFLEAEALEGDPGPPGVRGLDGATGATGAQGVQGPMGPAVFLEAELIEGDMGPPGPTGAAGAAGAATDPIVGLYSPGSFTVATEKYAQMSNHLKLTSTQRVTLQGTGRLSIYN